MMTRSAMRTGAGALLACSLAFGAQAPNESGAIVGRVEWPEDLTGDSIVQVLLLPPEWASEWNNDVQERLRVYFANNARAVDRDRTLFDRIAYRARREATALVAAQMQGNLGPEAYDEHVTGVDDDGTFEFPNLEFGEYHVVVVAQGDRDAYLWARPVRISGPIPEFVDMGEHFQ